MDEGDYVTHFAGILRVMGVIFLGAFDAFLVLGVFIDADDFDRNGFVIDSGDDFTSDFLLGFDEEGETRSRHGEGRGRDGGRELAARKGRTQGQRERLVSQRR